MNFSDQSPSTQWAALKYRGETIAEVWFKPDGEPFALAFRIPQESFRVPDMGQRLTPGNLLKSVGVAIEEVESWHHEDEFHPGMDGSNPEFRDPLEPPPHEVDHLNLYVNLKPTEADVPDEGGESEISEVQWQTLEARWKSILGLEASVDTLRISMEALRGEMESSSRRTLTTEEKVNALNSDVAQLNKAKSRVHYVLPKLKEFIHRATWATGTPERKKLEELYENHIRLRIPCPEMDGVEEQLDRLVKDRQILSAQGVSVQQECASVVADIQGVLRTLVSNAATNASKKRGASGSRGKSF